MLVTDSTTATDLLGRKKFAKQIVNSLKFSFKETHDAIVVGISGSWGCGKSTLLDYINNQIDEQYKKQGVEFKILKFNSWGNSGEESLERNFLEKILAAISEYNLESNVNTTNDKIKSYIKHLKYIQFLKHVHPVLKNISDGIDDYLETDISLENIKREANSILVKNEVKLFVLIDDLDRLTPKEITILFKILKVNLNLSNTIFMIAYDKNVVVNALANEYRFDGEKYLEKIIQVDFAVPPILQSQVHDIFFSRLQNYFEKLEIRFDNSDLKDIWKLHGFNEYFRSIRDINRYFNNLLFSLPNIGDDINIQDFLLLEAIRTFDNRAYNQLYHEIPIMYRKQTWMSIDVDEDFLRNYDNETTRALLNVLLLRDYKNSNATLEKRLKDRAYFERYFSLSIPSSDISESTLHHFFAKKSDKSSILRQLYKEDKMMNFLKRIKAIDNGVKLERSEIGIFNMFAEFWGTFGNPIAIDYKWPIIDVYFKFIQLFEDTHESAKAAIKNLIITSSDSNKVKFLINHYIHLNQIPSLKHIDYGQIAIFRDDLNKYFREFLKSQEGLCFMKINSGQSDWIDHHFIHSLAVHEPQLYLEKLEAHISKPSLLSFICSKFYMASVDGTVGSLTDRNTDILFPNETLEKAVMAIRNMPVNVLPEREFKSLQFFADKVIMNRKQ